MNSKYALFTTAMEQEQTTCVRTTSFTRGIVKEEYLVIILG